MTKPKNNENLPVARAQLVLRSHDPAEIRRWLKSVCAAFGTTPTALARVIEVAPSTLNKFLNNPEVKHQPSSKTINKVVTFVEDRLKFVGGDGRQPGAAIIEIAPVAHDESVDRVDLVGIVQAGSWHEASRWAEGATRSVEAQKDKRFPGVKRVAYEVRGPSMNDVYPEGTILFCVGIYDYGREVPHGKRVIVERRRVDGMVELTVKEYRIDERGRAWLWPRSSHPDHQQPIPLDDGSGEIESVEIKAIVTGKYSDE